MAVPGDGIAVVTLNKPNASFNQSARDESLPAVHGIAIGLSNVGRLAADIKGVNGLELHAGGQFVSLDARLNGRIFLARGLVSTIQRGQQRELTLLIPGCGIVVFDVLD